MIDVGFPSVGRVGTLVKGGNHLSHLAWIADAGEELVLCMSFWKILIGKSKSHRKGMYVVHCMK